jgi:hypothetical protein
MSASQPFSRSLDGRDGGRGRVPAAPGRAARQGPATTPARPADTLAGPTPLRPASPGRPSFHARGLIPGFAARPERICRCETRGIIGCECAWSTAGAAAPARLPHVPTGAPA